MVGPNLARFGPSLAVVRPNLFDFGGRRREITPNMLPGVVLHCPSEVQVKFLLGGPSGGSNSGDQRSSICPRYKRRAVGAFVQLCLYMSLVEQPLGALN